MINTKSIANDIANEMAERNNPNSFLVFYKYDDQYKCTHSNWYVYDIEAIDVSYTMDEAIATANDNDNTWVYMVEIDRDKKVTGIAKNHITRIGDIITGTHELFFDDTQGVLDECHWQIGDSHDYCVSMRDDEEKFDGGAVIAKINFDNLTWENLDGVHLDSYDPEYNHAEAVGCERYHSEKDDV